MTNMYTIEAVKEMGLPQNLARSIFSDLAFRGMRKATALDSLELSIKKRADVQLDPSERQRENQEILRSELAHIFHEMEMIKDVLDPEMGFKIEERYIPVQELDIVEFVLTKSNIREPEEVMSKRAYYQALERTTSILEGITPQYDAEFQAARGGPEGLVLELVNKAIEWLETSEPRKIEGEVSLEQISLSQWQERQKEKDLMESIGFIEGWRAMTRGAENGNDLEFEGELEVERMQKTGN